MATEKRVKNTSRDKRQVMGHEKRGVSPAGYTISLPIGTVHGDIPLLEDKPHMNRIVLVMIEALPRVKTEIKQLKDSNTRYTQDLIRVVAKHLPEALKELQTASVNRQDSIYEHEKIKEYTEKIEADITHYKQKTKENEEYLTEENLHGYNKRLPIGTVEIPFLEDTPHMRIIVLFMSEALPHLKTEIKEIKISKDRNTTRYTQDFIRVVAEHLPEALKELQTASVNPHDSIYEHEKIKQYTEKIETVSSYYKQKTKENEEYLTEENLRISDELRQAHEKEGQYKHLLLQMQTIIENNKQEITKLKMTGTSQEKGTEYQRLKTENSDLHQENQNLKEHLELANTRVKEQEQTCENLNLTMQKLSHEQNEKIKALKRFCEIQSNKHNEELEIEKHNAVLLKTALEKDRIFNVSQEKEKMEILKERNTLHDKLRESKEHILLHESKIKNLKSEISNLKVAHEMQQEENEKELGKYQKQNQQLLLDNIKLSNTFQQENDNAKTHKREYDAIQGEMLELREKLGKAVQRLKAADDIQRKLNVENDDLKNEMILLREEKIKFEAHYTHQKENERGQDGNEKELNRIKLASEMQQEALGKEIHKSQQQNQQLLQDIDKLYNDLHRERENSKKLQTECDTVTKELKMLKETQKEEKFRLENSNDIQQKVYAENQELKNEVSVQRREILKLKSDLTHQNENEREHKAKEQEINKLKLAFEIQQDALNKDIHKVQQHNQQLLQDTSKLYNDLQQEKDKAMKLQTEFDVVSERLQMLKQTLEEARLRLRESDDIRQKVNKENQELKNEMSEQRREIMKLKTDLTHRQENERERQANEQDINKLKLAYETQQDALNKDIHKAQQQNQQLLQDKAKLHNDLQQEKDNALKIQTEFDVVKTELQMLKETQNEARLRLRESDDIRQKVIKENQELKNEVCEQCREIMKLKTDLTQKENERKQNTNEPDIIKLKMAFEMQEETLLREIQDIKHQNQQLLLSNRKLHHDLQQGQDDASKYNIERDAIIAESNQLRIKHQEAIKIIKEAGDFQERVNAENEGLKTEVSNMHREIINLKQKLTKQQENANEHDQARTNLKKDMKLLQDQIKQLKTENKNLSKDLDIAQESAKTLDKHRSEKASFQDIITKQEKEISNLRFMLQEQNNLNENLSKEIERANLTVDKCKQQIMKQEQIIETQKRGIAKLESVNKKHDVEGRVANRNADSRNEESDITIKDLQQQLARVREQLKNVQQELDDTKSRLSRAMGDKLTDNNPNIADLSDRNRPTKISERYQELYDNQWTDAFEVVDRTIRNEEKTIETLMDILLETMDFCKAESANQMKTITETLSKGKDIPANTMKQIKDLRKSSAENYGKGLYTEYLSKLNQSKSMATKIPSFVKECFEICWLTVVQDPPVVLGPEIRRDAPFNKDHYKAYTKGGKRLDYVVWPVLLLHQDGPVLCKGVAQGY